MNQSDIFKMFNDQVAGKIDAATLDKLKGATSKKEALSILEGASVNLGDDLLAAVSGGADDAGANWCFDCGGNECPEYTGPI